MRVALITCRDLPEPDVDEERLLEALWQVKIDAEIVSWEEAFPYESCDLALIRSAWNYHLQRDAFVRWADATAKRTRLMNPAPIVRWNSHKSYLRELEARGVPVVPTLWLGANEALTLEALATFLSGRGAPSFVVKPQVSGGSFATRGFSRADVEAGRAFAIELARERDVMIQPYVASVDDHGERSLVCIDGAITHAVRKSPRFAGGAESVSGAMPIAQDEAELATRVLAPFLPEILYARVDMAQDAQGAPMVMELELIEPSLFLKESPRALERLVRAIRRLAGAP